MNRDIKGRDLIAVMLKSRQEIKRQLDDDFGRYVRRLMLGSIAVSILFLIFILTR